MTDDILFGDDDESPLNLDELPKQQPKKTQVKSDPALDSSRVCYKCGSTEVRIVCKSFGRRAYCTPCGAHWGIGGPIATVVPNLEGRGLSKQTIVPPDLSLAYEDLETDAGNFMRQGGPGGIDDDS